MVQRIKGVRFVWNDEIKQNIINELNEHLDSINVHTENHSYSDSIFYPITTNMFKPVNLNDFETPNYYESTISRNRAIKEIPVHTLAFADSFDSKTPNMNFGYASIPNYSYTNYESNNDDEVYDMNQIINSSGTVSFSRTPEQRGVAISKRISWKDILFNDVALI